LRCNYERFTEKKFVLKLSTPFIKKYICRSNIPIVRTLQIRSVAQLLERPALTHGKTGSSLREDSEEGIIISVRSLQRSEGDVLDPKKYIYS